MPKKEYRLILVDKHCFHIISNVIEFCKKEKTILACFLPHMTYFLQLLDISFLFVNAYWLALHQKFCLTKIASIKKYDFIIIYQGVKNLIIKKSTYIAKK